MFPFATHLVNPYEHNGILENIFGGTEIVLVPTNKKSSVVHEFMYHCDAGYVGRTTQILGYRLKKHVSSDIRNKTPPRREHPPRPCRSKNKVKTSDSAIGQRLLDNPDCTKLSNDDISQLIGRAWSSFHLAVLESI